MKNGKCICPAISVAVAATLVIGNGDALAHHPAPAFSGDTGGSIATVSATTLPQGSFAATINFQYTDIKPFSDEELESRTAEDLDPHSINSSFIPTLNLAYGVTENFTVNLSLPYSVQGDFREVEDGEVEAQGNIKGLGDLSLMGQYRFFENANAQFEAALLFGLKIPTGNTHEITPEGERFETDHQPGSGSWDPMFGLAVTKRFDSVTIDASFLYTMVTEGAQNTELGDQFFYGFGVTHRLGNDVGQSAWDLIFEVNGEVNDPLREDGELEESHGGHIIYLSPGVRISSPNGWAASLSVGVAVLNDMNGAEPDSDYRILAGFSRAF